MFGCVVFCFTSQHRSTQLTTDASGVVVEVTYAYVGDCNKIILLLIGFSSGVMRVYCTSICVGGFYLRSILPSEVIRNQNSLVRYYVEVSCPPSLCANGALGDVWKKHSDAVVNKSST